MTDTTSRLPTHSDTEPTRKKLRVRKGTKSCRECKRRKVRCIPSPDTDAVCGPCKRRGSTCISQEVPDMIARHDNEDTNYRLGRVEALVENLARKIDSVKSNPGAIDGRVPGFEQPPLPSYPLSEDSRQITEHRRIGAELLEAWPDKCDLDLILSLPLESSLRELLYKVGGILSPNPHVPAHPSLQDVLHAPQFEMHSVLIARQLLLLSLLLQEIPISFVRQLENLNNRHQGWMSRAMERAIRVVTTNDQLIGSAEGIECIMMESMYHDRDGNLRRSWVAIRRAMTMGQLMGLHRGTRPESCTKANVEAEYLWSRIVQADRYLSLMLGLPQGSPDNSFAAPPKLEGCSPPERLRRLHCVVAGHILQRNDLNDLSSTRNIDDLLQRALVCMPSQWWLTPDFATRAQEDDLEAPEKTLRLMSQAVHYHLQAQLHLPYLLNPSSDQTCTYSKIIAISASREVLSRFLAFRKVSPTSSYCHGIDFLAFIASTALCIAHLDAHGQKARAGMDGNIFNFLAHQRQGDRGMLEATVEAMGHMSTNGKDAIAGRIATVLQHLLAIEADASDGGFWSYNTDPEEDEAAAELECSGKMSEGDTFLKIHIPHLGRIKVKLGGEIHGEPVHAESREELPGIEILFQDDWGLQGVDSAFFDNLLQGMNDSDFVGPGQEGAWF